MTFDLSLLHENKTIFASVGLFLSLYGGIS